MAEDDFDFLPVEVEQNEEADTPSKKKPKNSSYVAPTTQIERASNKCGYPECDDVKKEKGRFCHCHEAILASRTYQAGLEGEEQKKAFVKHIRNTENAVTEIGEHVQDTIGSKKYLRKKKIAWAAWNELHGITLSQTLAAKKIPMEKKQFLIWRTKEFGRTDPEAEAEWKEWEESTTKRDTKGFKGCKRLWVLKEESDTDKKTRFQQGASSENSEQIKNPDNDDLDALRRHTNQVGFSFGNKFFQGGSNLSSIGSSFQSDPAPSGGGGSSIPSSPAPKVDFSPVKEEMEVEQVTGRARGDDEEIDLEDSEPEDDKARGKKRKISQAQLTNKKAKFNEKSDAFISSTETAINSFLTDACETLKKSTCEPLATPAFMSSRNLYKENRSFF